MKASIWNKDWTWRAAGHWRTRLARAEVRERELWTRDCCACNSVVNEVGGFFSRAWWLHRTIGGWDRQKWWYVCHPVMRKTANGDTCGRCQRRSLKWYPSVGSISAQKTNEYVWQKSASTTETSMVASWGNTSSRGTHTWGSWRSLKTFRQSLRMLGPVPNALAGFIVVRRVEQVLLMLRSHLLTLQQPNTLILKRVHDTQRENEQCCKIQLVWTRGCETDEIFMVSAQGQTQTDKIFRTQTDKIFKDLHMWKVLLSVKIVNPRESRLRQTNSPAKWA